jgi:hypothetical protein
MIIAYIIKRTDKPHYLINPTSGILNNYEQILSPHHQLKKLTQSFTEKTQRFTEIALRVTLWPSVALCVSSSGTFYFELNQIYTVISFNLKLRK